VDQFLKKVFSISLLLVITSCTPSVPYEIKSPCVAGDANAETHGITPCMRRPANLNYDIVIVNEVEIGEFSNSSFAIYLSSFSPQMG
jgi:hypothetical protein